MKVLRGIVRKTIYWIGKETEILKEHATGAMSMNGC